MKKGDTITIKRAYIIRTNKHCKGPDYKVGNTYKVISIQGVKVSLEGVTFPVYTWQIEELHMALETDTPTMEYVVKMYYEEPSKCVK